MDKLFQCEILTPMFLSGANKGKPEFRLPPFKGVMRYWWRAAQRAREPEWLKRNEAELFGAGGDTGGASKFKLKRSDDVELSYGGRAYMLPHKNELSKNHIKGNFSIRIMGRDPGVLDTAAEVFELSAILGGVGKRTRRGFGAFYLRPESTEPQSSLGKRTLELLTSLGPQKGCYTGTNEATGVFTIRPEQSQEENAAFRYPAIEEIKISKLSDQGSNNEFYPPGIKKLIEKIGHHSSRYKRNHGNALGSGNPRLASPVCISFYRDHNSDYLVTTLLSAKRNNEIQKRFRDEVIQDA